MKRAPWVALAAIALLVGTSAWSERKELPNASVPLDFTGIDTLVVRTISPEVVFDRGKPRLSHDRGKPMRVTRAGTTLTIEPHEKEQYRNVRLLVPVTLRRIVLHGGEVAAHVPVGELDIEGTAELTWKGDARVLRIVDAAPKPHADCDEYCRTVKVERGTVGELVVRSRHGRIHVVDATRVARIEFVLGADATYTLGGLRSAPTHVTVVGYADEPPAAVGSGAPAPRRQ